MRIEDIRTIDGPNVYHHKPVIVMHLHLDELAEVESCDVRGFVHRLLDLLPGLAEHHCSRGRAGGFVERLHEGTYFGHVVEHVALELAGLLESPVTFGQTRYGGEPGLYRVVVRYRSEAGMRRLLSAAVELVDALVRGEVYDLTAALAAARETIEETELGPSTRAIVDAADERGIPWRRLNDASFIQLGSGRHRTWIQATVTSRTSHIAVELASNKARTKALLAGAGVPVPNGAVARSVEEAERAFAQLGGRVVVKPLNGNQGKGVSVDVTTTAHLRAAFSMAAEFDRDVLIEEHLDGRDFRLLVVDGTMVAASERVACHVVGDGIHTIHELVDEENRNPRRGEGHVKPLTRIVLDDAVQECLARSGWESGDVPERGAVVFLRRHANLSQGGVAQDVTDLVHPDTRLACERAARAVGLDVCGIDVVTPDIARPLAGGIVEVNAAPGLRMHVHPTTGRPRPVGRAIVDSLYPPAAPVRIPIVSVTGTNGKTTVTRLIGHVMGRGGDVVGMTTSDGIWIGGVRIATGDTTGPASARTVLADPTVDVAVLETARGGILRRGLGYDWADVAVITNIQEDHLGQDGIEDIDDLIWIKSLVAERVAPGGTVVLNADDPSTERIMERVAGRHDSTNLVLFSAGGRPALLAAHLARGGMAISAENGWIVEASRRGRTRIVALASVPVTFGGTATHQVANCLAAAAASRALGRTARDVARSLTTFHPAEANRGRAQPFVYGAGRILLDYGHNPEAFRATAEMAARWGMPLIGIVGVPGDRDDALIEGAARVVAEGFDRIVVREDDDLRGRNPGEIAELIFRTVRDTSPCKPCRIVLDERDALTDVLPDVAAGAVVVHFYSELDPMLAFLEEVGAEPCEASDVPLRAAGPRPTRRVVREGGRVRPSGRA